MSNLPKKLKPIAELKSNNNKVDALIHQFTSSEIIDLKDSIFNVFRPEFSSLHKNSKKEQDELAQKAFYYTPNEIAEVIAEVIIDLKPQKVADICNGFSNILFFINQFKSFNYTPTLVGYEPDDSIRKLAQYTFPNCQILDNSLNHNDKNIFDVIVCELRIGRLISDRKREFLEEKYFRQVIQMLNDGGMGICIVPKSLLVLESFRELRTEFLSKINRLTVIEYPNIHESIVNRSLLVFEKGGKLKQVDFLYYSNAKHVIDSILKRSAEFSVNINKLENRLDYGFYNPENRKFENYINRYTTKKISELASVKRGIHIPSSERQISGSVKILRAANISKNGIVATAKDFFISNKILLLQPDVLLQKGDILLSNMWLTEPKFTIYKNAEFPSVADSSLIVIRSQFQGYLESFLKSKLGKSIFEEQLKLQGSIQILVSFLINIRVPILPLEDLHVLNDEVLERKDKGELELLRKQLQKQEEEITVLKNKNKTLEKHLSLLPEIVSKVDLMLEKQVSIEKKLDEILKSISELSDEIKAIQKLPRSEEDKIVRMYGKLEKKLNYLIQSQVDLEEYIDEIRRWFDYWDYLEPKSKSFLPEAEFLLDKISELPSPDFSPFIVQYSRALENEILKKLFISYHTFLVSKSVDREVLTKDDLENLKTSTFAKMVEKDKRNYTLGTMNFIMGMLKEGGETLSNSSLLKHFKEFSNYYFKAHIWEKAYLKKVNRLVVEYRNKAAHPNFISQEEAVEFHKLVKECISEFMRGYKFNENKEN